MNYYNFFSDKLATLQKENRYRYFLPIERCYGRFPHALDHSTTPAREIIVWCSNDYLGMGQHPEVQNRMIEVLETCGNGSGGTRNISGTTIHHTRLEAELADLHNAEAALIFTSGYVANETSIATLAAQIPGCVVFSDELNHASMINGIRWSKAPKHVFRHNDPEHLEELLLQYPLETPKLVLFESIYSMDGDFAPLKAFRDLCRKYNALSYVDEVHGVGMYGHQGAGIVEHQGLSGDFDIIQATFGKAIGLIGGYIAGKKEVIDFVRSFAPGFIFTTSLPPVIAAGVLKSIQILRQAHDLRTLHQKNATMLKEKLSKSRIPFMNTESHIVPVIVGDAESCLVASRILLEQYGIYVQPINYPTVPRGKERFRITPTPFHTEAMMDHLVDSLTQVWNSLSLRLAA